jgi:hypothetical protein
MSKQTARLQASILMSGLGADTACPAKSVAVGGGVDQTQKAAKDKSTKQRAMRTGADKDQLGFSRLID